MRTRRLVILGDDHRPIEDVFAVLLAPSRSAGRLVLQGDAFEFMLVRGAGPPLLVAKMSNAPFHRRPSLEVLLRNAVHVVFVQGVANPEYPAQVRAALGPVATFEEATAKSAHAMTRRAIDSLAGPRWTVEPSPSDWDAYDLVPVPPDPCYAGEVWGYFGPEAHPFPGLPTRRSRS